MSRSPVTKKGYGRGRRPGNAGLTYPPEALTPDEVWQLLQANDKRRGKASIRNRALIMVLYRTGLRIAEALDLRVKDIDFENGFVNVLRGKGGKRRTVGIDPSGLKAVREWLDVRVAPMGSPLFCTRDGRRMHATYFRATLRRLGQAAEIDKRIHPHMFRHTFAAELAREGVPPHVIQAQLGHSNLNTTTKYLRTIAPQEVINLIRARAAPWETEDPEEETA